MIPEIEGAVQSQPAVWKKRLVWTLVIIGCILFSLWAVSATVDMTIWGAYDHYIDALSTRLAINPYLANALSLLFVVPFFLGVRYYLFSLRDRKRKQRIGLAILLSMGVFYNLALYYGTRDQNFGPNGAVKFYALVPGGVVFSSRAGIEPIYGVPFRQVTPENIKWLKRIQQGRIALVTDPARHDWFDSVTADPLLWYSTGSAGNFRFFDGPGHDPATGAELKPVTPDIHQEWEKKGGAKNEPQANGSEAESRNLQESSPQYLVGQWDWSSSRDKFKMVMSITSHTPDGRFTGYLSNENGNIIGELKGDNIELTRELTRFGGRLQRYTGKLVGTRPNLRIIMGTWSGAFEENGEGTDWHAEMIPR